MTKDNLSLEYPVGWGFRQDRSGIRPLDERNRSYRHDDQYSSINRLRIVSLLSDLSIGAGFGPQSCGQLAPYNGSVHCLP
jgi:hypothetical protein